MFRYLLAIDGSDYSKRAAEYLANLTQLRKNIEITAIHVLRNNAKVSPEVEQKAIEHGWQILNDQTADFGKFGVSIKKQLIRGNPVQAITEYARLNDYTHIVIGSRGLTNFQGLVLGSVSHQVLHQSHCPVTIVK